MPSPSVHACGAAAASAAFKALPIHVINVFVLPLFTLSQEGTIAVAVVVVSVMVEGFLGRVYSIWKAERVSWLSITSRLSLITDF